MSRIAVITGATKGIGRAIADILWEDGFDLIVCSRSREDLDAMEETFVQKRPDQKCITQVVDVADRDAVLSFAAFIKNATTSIDVLVNNAGVYFPGAVLEEEPGVLEKTMQTNLYSAYHLTRALIPLLKAVKGSHVFNLCSIASIKAYPNGGAYTITKFAMLGFTKILREETKPLGIRVTAVIPGATWSDSWSGADFPEDRLMAARDIAIAVKAAIEMSPSAVVEEILIRPQLGDL